ncbi:unnamed protein product [Symbiodinium pilosum]|uniref:Uncharacterized protein n=1 Tax=Symbiodinium pilosum TaxID=2952 RepID=A0A812PBM6_SYMPI|nr:unnamed protein product [Symbiodinium pilosum]
MFEVRMAKKAVAVAKLGRRSDAVAAKLRYELARMKQAHLASLLLLWHSGRLSDIKNLVLNWDLRKKTAHGMQWVMDPVELKTKWRAVDADDPGKILHKKVAEALSEFLRRHRPILLKSLGQRARHNVIFQDEVCTVRAQACARHCSQATGRRIKPIPSSSILSRKCRVVRKESSGRRFLRPSLRTSFVSMACTRLLSSSSCTIPERFMNRITSGDCAIPSTHCRLLFSAGSRKQQGRYNLGSHGF